MTDERKHDGIDNDDTGIAEGKSSRRSLLRLGAVAVPAVVTLRSAWATGGYGGGVGGGAATSMAMCQIPIDDECDKDGKPRGEDYGDRGVRGARGGGGGGGDDEGGDGEGEDTKYFAPPQKGYYYGQELVDYQKYGTLPDGITSEEHFDAHIKYIKNLKPGDGGFTCLTSLVHKL